MVAIDRIRLAAQRGGWTETGRPVGASRLDHLVFTRDAPAINGKQSVKVTLTNHQPTPRVHHAWATTHADYPTGTVSDSRTTEVTDILTWLDEPLTAKKD